CYAIPESATAIPPVPVSAGRFPLNSLADIASHEEAINNVRIFHSGHFCNKPGNGAILMRVLDLKCADIFLFY
ncbi:hypothetical protein KWH83_19685, partial [Morganella morganii]|uniref:hypothetical protein n=1 Tax=Morganella morganii TaxID=582 RepID=UPI0021D29B4D